MGHQSWPIYMLWLYYEELQIYHGEGKCRMWIYKKQLHIYLTGLSWNFWWFTRKEGFSNFL